MLYRYMELEKSYGSEYKVLKALKDGKIFKVEKGLYSDSERVSPIEVINKKYPNAIFSSDYAYYVHNLTTVIPKKFYLTTDRNAPKIKDEDIVQIFSSKELLNIGKTTVEYEGVVINIYNKERMLIELFRNSKSMPLDYYKEIVNEFRDISGELDYSDIREYLENFNNSDFISDKIQKEVL